MERSWSMLMKIMHRGSLVKIVLPRKLMFRALALLLLLSVSMMPTTNNAYGAPDMQATSSLTFTAAADARVEERNPSTNTGTSNYLEVINANNRNVESYIRFTVSGVSGVIQSARVRVYAITEGTRNGPAVYATGSNWKIG